MPLDTSLLSESASLLRGNQQTMDQNAKTAAESKLQKDKAQTDQMQNLGTAVSQGITDGTKDAQEQRSLIPIDDTILNGVKGVYGEDSSLYKILTPLKGKKIKDTVYSSYLGVEGKVEAEKLKSQHQTELEETKAAHQKELQSIKDKMKSVGKTGQDQTKDDKGKDVVRPWIMKLDDEGNLYKEYSGPGANKFNPDSKEKSGKGGALSEKDLLAKRDAAAKSIRDFIAKNGTAEDSMFEFGSTRRKNADLRTMMSEQVKNYNKYQEQLHGMGSAEEPDQDILQFADKIKGQGKGGTESGQPKTISSQEEYDKLPSGSDYVWNNIRHRKK